MFQNKLRVFVFKTTITLNCYMISKCKMEILFFMSKTEYKCSLKDGTLEGIILKIKHTLTFDENYIEFLVSIFRKIRPRYFENYQESEIKLQSLIQMLKEDKLALQKLRIMFVRLLKNAEIIEIFTESGIEGDVTFFQEFKRRIKHKILPAKRSKGSLLHAVDQIFYKSDDYKWIKKVNKKLWFDLFSLLHFRVDFSDRLSKRLSQSLHIISSRILTIASLKEIRRNISNDELSAFIEQNSLSQRLINFNEHAPVVYQKYKIIEEDLRKQINRCDEIIQKIQSDSTIAGTSIQESYLLKRARQMLQRMIALLDIAGREKSADLWQFINLFYLIVENENTKNNLRKLFESNIQVLAFRISEHERDTGEHYITSGRKDFYKMFKSALGGGIIAGFIAVIKCFLHNIKMAPFWQGFAYSMNYATGFVLIHISGSTLATKQPAMTASAIASAMDTKKNNGVAEANMPRLAILVSKVLRSQTASFTGNLLLAFPVALLLAFLWYWATGANIMDTEHSEELLDMQNPLKSNSLLYACNTGFFLYLSGIITGYFDNKVLHDEIPERLKAHPFLIRTFKEKTLDKFANYVKKNLGPIIGNIAFGFFLGMTSFFADIFGIDFDIRHITISTGQFAVGLQGLNYHVGWFDLTFTILGILLIGFLNFLVSFILAFITASVSRELKFDQYRYFFIYLRRLIFRYPFDFIFPPKNQREEKDLMKRV